MANEIYANGMELACKAGAGKTICAMPDVCFTPPENPATPPGVPVPYPNTGLASDTTEGSKTVKISGEEIMLKNRSYFKKSTGDEAGCAAKKGMLSSTNTGKVYFIKWSMDVKFEGENVDRHFDMTTDNHNSPNANEAVPWMFTDSQALEPGGVCHEDSEREKAACKGAEQVSGRELDCSKCAGGEEACIKAKQCKLVPKRLDKQGCCSPHNTGHHLIPASCCVGVIPNYNVGDAPTVCAGGHSWHRNDRSTIPKNEKTHPALHEIQDVITRKVILVAQKLKSLGTLKGRTVEFPWKYKNVKKVALKAHKDVFGNHCSKKCIEAQLDEYHGKEQSDQERLLRAKKFGNQIGPNDPFLKVYGHG
jgi:hypothetical protein